MLLDTTLMNRLTNRLNQEPVELLGQIGNLQVRLAQNDAEITAAKKVRHSVFFSETGHQSLGLDEDIYDNFCDHLIVIDTDLTGDTWQKIVGTYRLMSKEQSALAGGYYSSGEFAVDALVARFPDRNFLELGRSCVLPQYRAKRTIELLWQGVWAYARLHRCDVMMGCASFSGTVPARHAEALSYLHHHVRANDEWSVDALPERHSTMDLMPEEAIGLRSAMAGMPPLIKGYLRLGATFGNGAVIDHEFGTVDVMVVMPVENISKRYKAHYGENAERFAA